MPIKQTVLVPKGFMYPIRGLGLILTNWRLFRLSLLPLLVNTVVFMIFLLSFNYIAYEISTRVFEESTQAWYWAALSMLIGGALFVVSIIVVMFAFVAVGLIIAAPFSDMLSAAVEEKLTGKVMESPMSLWGLVKFTTKNESKKMSVILLIQAALALVNLFPGAGQAIFAVTSPIFLALVVAFEFTGYSLDRRGFSFHRKRRYITSRLGLSLGFGLAVGITLVIPLINFLLLPLAVAGGTMMVVENPPETAGSASPSG